jgi:hypothetical protein
MYGHKKDRTDLKTMMEMCLLNDGSNNSYRQNQDVIDMKTAASANQKTSLPMRKFLP